VQERLNTTEAVIKGPFNEVHVPASSEVPLVEHFQEANPSVSTEVGRYQRALDVASRIYAGDRHQYSDKQRPDPVGEHLYGARSDETSTKPKDSRQESVQSTKATWTSAEPGLSLPSILLVEDNVINQKILKRKLETKGFNVTTANNGQEAVDAVRGSSNTNSSSPRHQRPFDCVLMDQAMPVLDGNGATKVIREWENCGNGGGNRVPILGVTANVREEQKSEMTAAGMDDVISKPFKIDEIVERMRKWMVLGKRNNAA